MQKKIETIEYSSSIVRKNDTPTVDFDGEVAMMDVEKGVYYGMDLVGSRIWDLLEHPTTINDIVANLIVNYDIDKTTCQEQVHEFIISLIDKKLVLLQ